MSISFLMLSLILNPGTAYMQTSSFVSPFSKKMNVFDSGDTFQPSLVSNKISCSNNKASQSEPTTLYDNFEGDTYTLVAGQTSSNGKWQNKYTGYGVTGVAKDPKTCNRYFYEKPKISTSPDETHASMVITTKNYSNFDMALDMNTAKQLRQNSRPNAWEVAWIAWHYTDDFHSYAFFLKPTGFQIEKKDNNIHDDSAEIYLNDGQTPKLKIGQWVNVRIVVVDNHIRVGINGINIADFYDKIPNSPQMSYGAIGLYNEDSSVKFDNISITPIGR
jgi:3-keto-disaccharide hydrolase